MKRLFSIFILFTIILSACFAYVGEDIIWAVEDNSKSQLATDIEPNELSGSLEVILNIDETIMTKYIQAFQQKYPNVTVKYTGYSNYEESILSRLESNDYGDVLFIPASLDTNGVKKYLEPLGEIAALSEKYNFVENAYIIDKQVYSLPSSAYLKGIIYNKEVFNKAGITEAPKSQDAFIRDLEMIKERTDAIPFYTCYDLKWILVDWSFFPFIETTGDNEYKGTKFVYDKDPFLEGGNYYEAYKLLYEIVRQNLHEGSHKVYDWGELCRKLNSGKIASVVAGTWAYSQIKNAGDNGDAIAFMPYPNEINGKQYATIGIDYGYCISKNSTNKEAARKFIEFMLDESGYALDDNRISIVKSDPLPEVYSKITNLDIQINAPFEGKAFQYYNILSDGESLDSPERIMEVIDVASGKKAGNYDQLMQSWNSRWEDARPRDMKTIEYELGTNVVVENNHTDTLAGVIVDNYQVDFSNTEKEYLKQNSQVRVGFLTGMAPFQYEETQKDGTKTYTGLSDVICRTIEECTNLRFLYVPYTDNESMINDLRDRKIDLIAGVASDDKNIEGLRLSKEYLELSNVILKSDNLGLTELSNKKQAYVKGFESKFSISSNSEMMEYSSYSELVKAIEKKRADFAVLNYYSANYYMKENDCSYVTPVPLTGKTQYCLAFSDEMDSRLVSICNKCIYSIPEESIQMSLMEYMDPAPEDITLAQFISTYPVECSMFLILLLLFVLLVISFIHREKVKNRKKHEMDTKRYEILSQLTDEYVFEYTFSTEHIHFDKKFDAKFGFGENISLLTPPTDNEALKTFLQVLDKEKTNPAIRTEPFEIKDKKKQKQWYRMIAYCILGDKEEPQHIIGKLINVQQAVEEQQKIQDKADRDSLTTLYNRLGFSKRFQELKARYPKQTPIAFGVLDIDNFKNVNDSLGHMGGDEAIKYLAQQLHRLSGETILTSRYGGDEFMICMFDIAQEKAQDVLESLVRKMDTSISFEGKQHNLSISLGAVYTMEDLSLDDLFAEADKVLYTVKNNEKNGYQLHIR